MNHRPQPIIVPTTAHRIPRTPNADEVVRQLLSVGINASAFLMDAEQLEELETEEFVNDFDRAFEDFYYQIPSELRLKVFPIKLEEEKPPETRPRPRGSGHAPRVAH